MLYGKLWLVNCETARSTLAHVAEELRATSWVNHASTWQESQLTRATRLHYLSSNKHPSFLTTSLSRPTEVPPIHRYPAELADCHHGH